MDGKNGIAAVGWVVFWGAVLTGVIALISAVTVLPQGNLPAAGIFLLAAALAFGLLANTIYRN